MYKIRRRKRTILEVVLLFSVYGLASASVTKGRRLCLHFGRRCWAAHQTKNSTQASVDCTKCWRHCNRDGTADSFKRRDYCQWVCDELTCGDISIPHANRNSTRTKNDKKVRQTTDRNTTDVQLNYNTTQPRNVNGSDTNASRTKKINTTDISSLRKKSVDESDVWIWLGPVLGALATMFGAFITVYAVRESSTSGVVSKHESRSIGNRAHAPKRHPEPPSSPLGVNAPRSAPHEYASPFQSNYLWR